MITAYLFALGLVAGTPPANDPMAVGKVGAVKGTVILSSPGRTAHTVNAADVNTLVVYEGDTVRVAKGGELTIHQFNGLNSTLTSSLGERIRRVANAEEMVLRVKLKKGLLAAPVRGNPFLWPSDNLIIPRYFEVVGTGIKGETSASVAQKGQNLWSGTLKADATGALTNATLCKMLAKASRTDPFVLTIGSAHTEFRLVSAARESQFDAAVKSASTTIDPYAKFLQQAAVLVEYRQLPAAKRRIRALGL